MRERIEGVPVPVAAMRLLMQADTPEAALAALERAVAQEQADARGPAGGRDTAAAHDSVAGRDPPDARGPEHAPPRPSRAQRIAELIARNPSAWSTVRAVIRSIDHVPVQGDAIAHWARLFDSLVRISPEASVALYSLGNAQLLAAATAEIVALLDAWGLLRPPPAVLDIGCGIGRLEAALAPRVASISGLDIAPAMLAEARRRCGHLANVDFRLASGGDLRGIADASADLIALIDTLPYLVLCGPELASGLLVDSARVLRPGGSIVILNASYRDDADADLADLERLASHAGLHFLRADWRPFESWDAPAFQLVRR